MAEQQLPVWNSEGIEPPANLQINGWQPGVKPPAQYFDWLFNRAYKCLEELQAITEALETNKANGTDLTTLNNKVTQHLDESSGKHIHSSGSNANGRWIKFDDGTLICYSTRSIDFSVRSGLTYALGAGTFTPPALFINNNIAGSFAVNAYSGENSELLNVLKDAYVEAYNENTTTFNTRFWFKSANKTTTSIIREVTFTLIGRWKA